MANIHDSITDLIGHTPLVRLSRMVPQESAEVCGKLESKNPGGSVKDRPALSMVERAEKEGVLKPGSTIVEATSGNTGISLAMIAAARGYRCVVVMPEDMSMARRYLLKSYGAQVVLTPAELGMSGAVERAESLVAETPNAMMPRQFDNEANPEVHAATTATEIWEATGGAIDAFVAGVGTGGTVTGVGRFLKQQNPNIEIVAVEPRTSAVLSGGKPGLHGIQGLGAGFVPAVYDAAVIDRVVTVSDLEADRATTRLAREEGILSGPSAGANVHVACLVARRLGAGKRVVTIICDIGERYMC